jgi:cellulose synthase/poly-beta-1,6-N-acetylglucosamine synthase-like glycosyltransferase
MTLRERSVDSMSWVSADRLLRWATVAPLTIAGVAAAAAGAYLDLLAAAAFANPPAGELVPPTSRLVVLVPAHNEADFIGRCLGSLDSQDYPPDLFQVVVIADNCTDATASIAASMGARVLVRDDPEAPGKGPALRWAMDRLLAEPGAPDAVVVVDADTVAGPSLLGALASRVEAGADAVQGEYLALPEDDSPGATLRAAGFLLFHKVRFSGRAALGLPCNLVGNGMLFSRRLLEEMPWKAFTSAEDLEYSVDLRLAGHRPVYAHDACLRAPLPSGGRAASVQRLRWEGGRFHVVRTRLPKLLREIAVARRWSLLDAAVDLAVPPLGVLAVVAVAGTAASTLLVVSGVAPVWVVLPWVVASASIPAFVLGGLASAGAPAATYRALALAPRYVASSLLTRLRLLGGLRADTWERTERPSDAATTGTHSKRGNGPSST